MYIPLILVLLARSDLYIYVATELTIESSYEFASDRFDAIIDNTSCNYLAQSPNNEFYTDIYCLENISFNPKIFPECHFQS